jgi:hypothetical protein
MSTTAVEVPLSEETRERLEESSEIATIRQRLAKAEAGGPFVRQEDVLAWLKALSDSKEAPPPKPTITS